MIDPVIIVGAPRSGTNLLRDVLTSAPGVETWPCDEINPIWKHGNLDLGHDEIPAERASSLVRSFVQSQFAKLARKRSASVLIEKTCANSLRVPFTSAIFPTAKYIFIRRNGIDATASAIRRWNAPLEIRYTMRKVRYVPARDLPRQGYDFFGRRIRRDHRDRRDPGNGPELVTSWWGPKPHDFEVLMSEHPLDELAFIQWERCITQSADALADLPQSRVLEVRYEDFVRQPGTGIEELLNFIGIPELEKYVLADQVSISSIAKGRSELSKATAARLENLGKNALERFS